MYQKKLIQGTCGWSDQSLVNCGRFYPPKTKSSSEKLSYYSRGGGFGCVEVDSSTYAIPTIESVKSWIESTPSDFVFHVKAFGMLCNGGIDIRHLPSELRSPNFMKSSSGSNSWITMESLGAKGRELLWKKFNDCVRPMHEVSKLGCVVFQYQLNFVPNEISRHVIESCASNLSSDYKMAVEFRERIWTDAYHLDDTIKFLQSLRPEGVVLIAADDLEHEMHQSDRNQLGPAGCKVRRLPIVATTQGSSSCAYIRVHRRHGNNRILSDEEIAEWSDRISELTKSEDVALKGPVYFLWGTDHEDQPVINARRLHKAVAEIIQCNWTSTHTSAKGNILGHFKPKISDNNLTPQPSKLLEDVSNPIYINHENILKKSPSSAINSRQSPPGVKSSMMSSTHTDKDSLLGKRKLEDEPLGASASSLVTKVSHVASPAPVTHNANPSQKTALNKSSGGIFKYFSSSQSSSVDKNK